MNEGSAFSEVGIAQNDREDIVEIVGDPAGKGPEALEFLGLDKFPFQLESLGFGPFYFLLGLFALRDVAEKPYPPVVTIIRTDHRRRITIECPPVGQGDLFPAR